MKYILSLMLLFSNYSFSCENQKPLQASYTGATVIIRLVAIVGGAGALMCREFFPGYCVISKKKENCEIILNKNHIEDDEDNENYKEIKDYELN